MDQKIASAHERDSSYLPDFAESSALIAASDYSGEHHASKYHVFCFVITSSNQWIAWERQRQLVRHQHRLGRRRMSFTKLNDRLKSRALRSFLASVESMESVLCSVVINKSITSVFDRSGRIDLKEWGLGNWGHWDPAAFEKMLRVIHLVAFFLAGLASAGQNIIWATDEDAIAPSFARLEELTANFTHLIDRYLTRKIGHIRCASTAGDTGILDVEDLAAIPDLIGGAFAELFSAYAERNAKPSIDLSLPQPENLSAKAQRILTWLASANERLRRLVYVVEPGHTSEEIEVLNLSLASRPLLYLPPDVGA